MSMDDQFKKLDEDYWKTNRDLKEEIQKLKQQLADAEKVIDFYADPVTYDFDTSTLEDDSCVISYCDDTREWESGVHTHYPYNDLCGGRRAREYKSKYKVGE